MVQTLIGHVKRAAKAYVAVATPIVAAAVAELVTELNSVIAGLVAVAIGGLVTYAVPNSEA